MSGARVSNRIAASQTLQSVLALAIRLAAGGANYLLFATIARLAGPAEFGTFSIVFSGAMLVGFAGSFGQQIFLVKQVPQERTRGSKSRELGAYCFSALVTLALGGLFALAFFSLAPRFTTGAGLATLAAGAAFALLFAASQTIIGALRVQNRTLLAIAMRDVFWRLLSVAAIAAVAIRAGSLDAGAVFVLLCVVLFAVIVGQTVLVARRIVRDFRTIAPKIDFRHWFEVSAGLALIAVISSADIYVYTIALGYTVSPAEGGVFFAAFKTVELLNMFLMAVTLIVGPEMSRLVAIGDAVQLQQKCNTALLLQSVPVALSGVAIFVLAPLLMAIFDPSYAAHADLMRVLALGMLINALTGATVLLLQLSGLHWRQVLYQGGSLLASLAVLPLFVQGFGLIGAAYCFVLSKTAWNLLAIAALRTRLKIDPSLLGLFDSRTGGLAGALRAVKADLAPVGG
jgi:O-antigen/teichoic acid export membrane protein